MNSDERAALQRCFNQTKELFQRKTQSEDWAENLITGSQGLTTQRQWKHYYVWLANPKNYDEERTERMEIDTTPPKIDPYPPGMKVETFQNGPCETLVHVTNPHWNKSQQDDEDEKSMEVGS